MMSRTLSRGALLFLAFVAASACEDEPLTPDTAPEEISASTAAITFRDRSALREIVRTLDEAWTDGDPVRYAAIYAGADFVGPDASVLTDPAAITDLYTALFTFVFPNTKRTSTIRNMTFLSGRIAVLDIDTRVRGFESLPPGIAPWRPRVIRALEKNVLIKEGGEWRIVQHQQTLMAPEP
jgi:uncharacterized protein (TIGR02246 family)